MSVSDDYSDTPVGSFAQDFEDDTGVNPFAGMSPETIELMNERAAERESDRQQADRDQQTGQPQQQHHATAPPDPVSGGMSDGQTIHDAAHWLGKAVGEAGEMVGGEFVGTGDWSGGILQDDVTPLEHRVVTGEDGKVTEADWVGNDGSLTHDSQYDKDNQTDDGSYFYYDDSASGEYDSGFDDGYQEGFDDATNGQDDDYYSD